MMVAAGAPRTCLNIAVVQITSTLAAATAAAGGGGGGGGGGTAKRDGKILRPGRLLVR